MSWYDGLEDILRRNEPLAKRTTFRIGGPAATFLEPDDERQFALAYSAALRSGLPVHILGGGSNLLICDEGVPGVVLSTALLQSGAPAVHEGRVVVRAGMRLSRLVRWTAQSGLAGLECLAGIPGTVGGAVRMNAGGRYGCVGGRVEAIWCADRRGETVMRQARHVRWGYRSTDIAEPILAVEFQLERDSAGKTEGRLTEILEEKRSSQPVELRSAGCFFKNPPKESAGRLIDGAGMKGRRVGGACVSDKHANFIVNLGGATARDVLALSTQVRERVRECFRVSLESEVCYWPQAAY